MPRIALEPRFQVEYLSILDSDGNLDTALEPKLADHELKSLYRAMLLGRRLDERMVRLQRQGRIGTFAPTKGQEAAQIGSIFTLRPTDWMVPSFRETAAMIWRGWPIEKLLLFFAGHLEGGQPAPSQHDLPITIPVATQLPHAVGLAYAAQYRGDDVAVMAYFGDGATSEGDFHEALNFAGVWHVPVVFVCQNNQWAISVPLKKQTHSRTIAQKALAYGLPGIQVDGNDVLAVYAAAREAVGRARADLGAAQEADALAHDRPEGARVRPAGHPGRRQRRARGLRCRARGCRSRAGRSRCRSRSRRTRARSPRRRSRTACRASRSTATTCSRSTLPRARLSVARGPATARP